MLSLPFASQIMVWQPAASQVNTPWAAMQPMSSRRFAESGFQGALKLTPLNRHAENQTPPFN